ncbi:hypothetical protein Tco_0475322 [Tanacetum coccineum]
MSYNRLRAKFMKDDLEAMALKWPALFASVMGKESTIKGQAKKNFINAKTIADYDKSKESVTTVNKLGQNFSRDTEHQEARKVLIGVTWQKNKFRQIWLLMELFQTQGEMNLNLKHATYKKQFSTLEDQIITLKKEILFSEEVVVLKREVGCKNYEINMLKSELEKVKLEKDGIDFEIEKFDKASKDLDQLLGSQITDKIKKGLGYSAVPPPHPLIYNRPKKLDLSYYGLDEFKEPEFKGYDPEKSKQESNGKPQHDDKGFVDSGCSRHMTGNIAYLLDFKEFDGGYVAFGGGAYGGRITGKGTLKTDNLDFEDVYFVNELNFNLFSVLQMCDKKNYVLFTDTECLVLSLNFKLPDENQILHKIPRKDNMYSFDMKNIVPKESLTCLVAKATLDESML